MNELVTTDASGGKHALVRGIGETEWWWMCMCGAQISDNTLKRVAEVPFLNHIRDVNNGTYNHTDKRYEKGERQPICSCHANDVLYGRLVRCPACGHRSWDYDVGCERRACGANIDSYVDAWGPKHLLFNPPTEDEETPDGLLF